MSFPVKFALTRSSDAEHENQRQGAKESLHCTQVGSGYLRLLSKENIKDERDSNRKTRAVRRVRPTNFQKDASGGSGLKKSRRARPLAIGRALQVGGSRHLAITHAGAFPTSLQVPSRKGRIFIHICNY
ncbi:hypothetical protein CEXT_762631 [Caerostris extrusa]|uniref:Uncharacterized protein n=1 Tax=Caerostris extrusa TaxID=172846 RepID=A0AAV4S6V5_CAEEX|nr:hypothetical protein CEXT_762631 [Caerostris extrusa]